MGRKRALSSREVEALNKTGLHRCDDGLYLQVRDDGTRSFVFRYTRAGKMRVLGLGPASRVPYSEVRQTAAQMQIDLWKGIDVAAERRSVREHAKATLSDSSAPSFQWCADQYIAAHEGSWKSDVHRRQWEQTLKDYAGPSIGKMAVDRVGVDDVFKVLQPLWKTKSETAGRLRGRISKVLGWARAKGYRTGDDPAARGGPLDHLLPSLASIQKVEHHASIAYAELPAVMTRLQELDSTSATALLFTILTGVRTGETLGAEWKEVDIDAKTWAVPADRTKTGEEHRVPLSDQAVALLRSLPRKGTLVFPGAKKGKPLSNMALLQCLRGIRDDGATVHGFRSSFSTWAREQTDYPTEVIEAALAHKQNDKVIAAYARTSYFDRRRALMQDWADYCFNGSAAAS